MIVKETLHGDIAVLQLSRPESLNAINQATVDALNEALDGIEKGSARALVITGEGRAFSAGADLKARDEDPVRRVQEMHRLALRLASFPKVSIAAVNGLAYGGGCELAMYCTLRVASPSATFAFPEIHRSLMPGYGGTQLLPRLVGREHAVMLLLTGDPIDAVRAHQIGLITSVEDDVVAAAVALADRCSRSGLLAQQSVRRAVSEGPTLPLEEALALEARLVVPLAEQPEAIAASAAFMARLGSKGRS